MQHSSSYGELRDSEMIAGDFNNARISFSRINMRDYASFAFLAGVGSPLFGFTLARALDMTQFSLPLPLLSFPSFLLPSALLDSQAIMIIAVVVSS